LKPAPSNNPISRPWFLKSKLRLFSILFLLLAIPTAVLTAFITWHVRNELKQQAIYQNVLTAQLVSNSVSEEFLRMRKYVESLSRRAKIIEYTGTTNTALLRDKLAEMVSQNEKINRAFATDISGHLIADFPFTPDLVGKDFSERDWFKGALAQQGAYVSEIYKRMNVDGANVITVCTRVQDPNTRQTIGYVGGQLTTDRLVAWLEKTRPPSDRALVLLDQHGQQALRKAANNIMLTGNQEIQKAIAQKEGSLFFTDIVNGSENLASFERIPLIDWTVVAVQTTDAIFGPLRTLLKTVLIAFVLCLAGMTAIGLFWFNTLSKYDERRQKSEDELKTHAVNLKRSNEELEALCYSIAHDLRGPLRSIRGMAIALREDCSSSLDEMGRDYVARLDGSAERMDQLTKDLLDYGRLSHVALTLESINLATVIDKTVMLFAEEIHVKGGQVEIKRPLPVVRANAVMVEQILNNLISNALKFIKPNVAPRIKIWAEENDQTVFLRVKDNGIGIEAAHLQRIFGIFERLHDYQAFPGTGIGLALVRKGAERLGGRVGVESKFGEGSCFWIELPRG
jgi:signal transduction histidine kinase